MTAWPLKELTRDERRHLERELPRPSRGKRVEPEVLDAQMAARKAVFNARLKAQDPNDPLTHDPMWNPHHPEYVTDEMLAAMMSGKEVVVEADLPQRNGDGTSRSGGSRPRSGDEASDKQVAWIRQMLDDSRIVGNTLVDTARSVLDEDGTLYKDEARAVIDVLKLEPRRNERPGPCDLCSGHVEARDGTLTQISGRWSVRHYMQCPDKPEVAPVASGGLDMRVLGAGSHRFAVPGGDSRLKIRIDVIEGGKWGGWVFVKDAAEYGIGKRYGKQQPGGTYEGDITDELAAILADLPAAMARYGELTGNCSACNRHLEDDESIRLGIGPVCRTKGR